MDSITNSNETETSGALVTHLHADPHLQIGICYGQTSFQPVEPLDQLTQFCQLGLTASEVCHTEDGKITVRGRSGCSCLNSISAVLPAEVASMS